MYSRAGILSGQFSRSLLLVSRSRNISTTSCLLEKCPPNPCSPTSSGGGSGEQEFKRPVRADRGPPVRMGFIPDSWFRAFYNKTGVTGPYMFGFGLSTYLISKEIYVMEHEYYTGLSILIAIVFIMKKYGHSIAGYLNKEVDAIEKEWKDSRKETLQVYKDAIESEKKEQDSAQGQLMLMAAKRENVSLQLEAAYRERLMNVYREVKKRLDYQVERQNIERRIAQKHMVEWVVNHVMSSITPDQQKETLQKCIADLDALSRTAK